VIWQRATIEAARQETPRSRTLVLDVPDWSGHLPGQHVDVRLTAEDGYTAVRSYSIASASDSGRLEVTVDRLDDGEVSPYLVDIAEPGTMLEVRGPNGRYFVWDPADERPVQLIGGGSGVVPLMSMIRTHGDRSSTVPFRLLYSARSPALALFRDEIAERAATDASLDVTWTYSREAPPDWTAPVGRLTLETLDAALFPRSAGAVTFVCGSTPFVERVATWLQDAECPLEDIRTERYGG